MPSETKKQRFVRTLREVADFIESRPFCEDSYFWTGPFYLDCVNAEVFGKNVAAAGSVEKEADGGFLNATVMFGDIKFQIYIGQEKVCKRVKVGEKVIPATEAKLIDAEPERVEYVYEYQCPDSFLALKDKQVSDKETEELVSSETDQEPASRPAWQARLPRLFMCWRRGIYLVL